ncbi:hypothetical protein [Geminicoccus roseus]|uniref:hypothetical protein n=1 Tax=Geminicoccus roseus TaxID=404900 RepID=UPI000428EF50|nr:hypothetical protein [Geminicoccus roseus]
MDSGAFRLVVGDDSVPLDGNGDGVIDEGDPLATIGQATFDGRAAASLQLEINHSSSTGYAALFGITAIGGDVIRFRVEV